MRSRTPNVTAYVFVLLACVACVACASSTTGTGASETNTEEKAPAEPAVLPKEGEACRCTSPIGTPPTFFCCAEHLQCLEPDGSSVASCSNSTGLCERKGWCAAAADPAPVAACKPGGVKCVVDSDCCSKRCEGGNSGFTSGLCRS